METYDDTDSRGFSQRSVDHAHQKAVFILPVGGLHLGFFSFLAFFVFHAKEEKEAGALSGSDVPRNFSVNVSRTRGARSLFQLRLEEELAVTIVNLLHSRSPAGYGRLLYLVKSPRVRSDRANPANPAVFPQISPVHQ